MQHLLDHSMHGVLHTHMYMHGWLSSFGSQCKIYLLPYLHEDRLPHLFLPSAKLPTLFWSDFYVSAASFSMHTYFSICLI